MSAARHCDVGDCEAPAVSEVVVRDARGRVRERRPVCADERCRLIARQGAAVTS